MAGRWACPGLYGAHAGLRRGVGGGEGFHDAFGELIQLSGPSLEETRLIGRPEIRSLMWRVVGRFVGAVIGLLLPEGYNRDRGGGASNKLI